MKKSVFKNQINSGFFKPEREKVFTHSGTKFCRLLSLTIPESLIIYKTSTKQHFTNFHELFLALKTPRQSRQRNENIASTLRVILQVNIAELITTRRNKYQRLVISIRDNEQSITAALRVQKFRRTLDGRGARIGREIHLNRCTTCITIPEF